MSERWKNRILVVLVVLSLLLGGLLAKREVAAGFTPDRPPAEFRDGRRVTVVFSDKSEFLCMLAGAPNRFACASPATNTMYLPNPCNQKGAWPNPLACHEMAHTADLRGKFWPADHPK